MAALGRLRRSQGRLAEEDVCVPRELGELRARARVSGIRKRAAVVRDPQTEGQLAVVLEPQRDDVEAGGAERLRLLVLADVEDAVDPIRERHLAAVRAQPLAPARR